MMADRGHRSPFPPFIPAFLRLLYDQRMVKKLPLWNWFTQRLPELEVPQSKVGNSFEMIKQGKREHEGQGEQAQQMKIASPAC